MYDFDGANDRVSWSLPAGFTPGASQNWTLSTWFVIDSFPTASFHEIFALGDASANEHCGIAVTNSGAVKIISDGKTSGSGTTLSTGVVYHLALSWDGTTLRIALNGAEDYTKVPSPAITWSSLDELTSGLRSNGDFDFDGRIGEWAMWDVDLFSGGTDYSLALQLARYESPESVRPQDLIFYAPGAWHANDIIGGLSGSLSGDAALNSEHPLIAMPGVLPMAQPSAAVGGAHTITPSGGLSLGGTTDILKSRTFLAAGGITLGGAQALLKTHLVAPAGGVQFGGTAPFNTVHVMTPSGGLALGGVSAFTTHDGVHTITPAGGLLFDGTAPMYAPAADVFTPIHEVVRDVVRRVVHRPDRDDDGSGDWQD